MMTWSLNIINTVSEHSMFGMLHGLQVHLLAGGAARAVYVAEVMGSGENLDLETKVEIAE